MSTVHKIRRVVQPAFYNVDRDGITQSILALYQQCRRKADLAIRKGIVRESSGESYAFGGAFHGVNDLVFTHFMRTGEVISATQAVTFWDEDSSPQRVDPAEHERRETMFAQLEAVYEGYQQQWAGDFTDKKWVALEDKFEFSLKLSNGRIVPIKGKIDGLAELVTDSSLQLKETKTRGQVDEDGIVDKLPIDLQVNLYAEAVWQKYGRFPKSVLYDVVRRPLLRLGKKETLRGYMERIIDDCVTNRPDHYYFRYISALDEGEHAEWMAQQLIPLVEEFVAWVEGSIPTLQNTTSCVVAGFKCPYLQLCGNKDETGLIRKNGPSPELEDDGVYERFLHWLGSK